MMFAIITPALIVGAIAERMKYASVITPAAGFVTASSAVLIGVIAQVVPFLACTKLKAFFKYDDALDTFGVHGGGGTVGALLAGVFANPDVNANLKTNLAGLLGHGFWLEQLKAIGVTLTLSIAGTAAIAYAIKATLGLRPSLEDEEAGLDGTDHGEAGYHGDEGGGSPLEITTHDRRHDCQLRCPPSVVKRWLAPVRLIRAVQWIRAVGVRCARISASLPASSVARARQVSGAASRARARKMSRWRTSAVARLA